MKIEDIKNTLKEDKKTKIITIRISANDDEWIKKNNINVSKVFNKSIYELKFDSKFSGQGVECDKATKLIKNHLKNCKVCKDIYLETQFITERIGPILDKGLKEMMSDKSWVK